MKTHKEQGYKNIILSMLLIVAVLCTAVVVRPLPVEGAAKTKKIYVITGLKVSDSSKITFSYNKNGLITGRKTGAYLNYFFTYDKKNRIQKNGERMKYDKKGRVKGDLYGDYVYKYNKKGYLASINSSKYSFNKKGQLTKYVQGNMDCTYKFSYDKRGSILSVVILDNTEGSKTEYKYKNTYKNGRLTRQKRTYYDPEDDYTSIETYTYTYKKITVPANMVTRIKAQQKWIYLHAVDRGSLTYSSLEGLYK